MLSCCLFFSDLLHVWFFVVCWLMLIVCFFVHRCSHGYRFSGSCLINPSSSAAAGAAGAAGAAVTVGSVSPASSLWSGSTGRSLSLCLSNSNTLSTEVSDVGVYQLDLGLISTIQIHSLVLKTIGYGSSCFFRPQMVSCLLFTNIWLHGSLFNVKNPTCACNKNGKTSMRDHQLCSWWKWMEYDGILIGQMLDDIVKVLLYCYYAFYLYIPAMLCWVCLMTLYDNPFQGFWNVGYLSGCLDDQRICTEQFTVFKIIYSISPDLRTHQSYVFCTFLCVFCP